LRYFFHVTDGTTMLKDEEGQSFSSLDDAKAHAIVIASELARDGTYHGWALWVTDDHRELRSPGPPAEDGVRSKN
jgi:hypothetical protein